jgi:signal transduction histidine kinase
VRLRFGGRVAAGLAFCLLVGTALLLNLNLVRVREARDLVRITNEILQASAELETQVINAETGQRGYLLTGERRYLQPYEAAATRLAEDVARLQALTLDPGQKGRVAALAPLVEAKLAELRQTVELRQRSLEEALAVVRTDEGQRLTEEIRAVLAEFDAAERRLLDERTLAQERQAEVTTALATATGLFSLLTALFGATLLRRGREEDRLREVNAGLERRVTERTAGLAEANRELDAFAHTVSHDLRAPIRAMRGYAAALEEDVGEALGVEGRQYVERIDAAAGRMDALVEDILAYSRLAREDIRTGRVDLEAVVDAALEAIGSAAVAEPGAAVEVRRPMPAVRAQAAMLRQAVQNLLANALKFTEPGRAPVVRVWSELGADGATVRLWVEDEGIGIAPTHQERIFVPFERLHGRETYPGTGIGLAIVSRVAERLGGACGVYSRPGGGSRFWIDLPAWRE